MIALGGVEVVVEKGSVVYFSHGRITTPEGSLPSKIDSGLKVLESAAI